MIRSFRQLAVAAVAAGVASGAFAAQTTVEFKKFYDTSTIFNTTDTKTLDYSVGFLKLTDNGSGGVTGKLTFNDTAFPAGSKGLTVDELWLAGSGAKGTKVTATSGDSIKASYYSSGFTQERTKFNYDIDYTTAFKEGETSTFTISNTSVASFMSGAGLKGVMLEVTGVGKPYNGFLGLNSNVRFIGQIATIPEPGTYALMALGLVGIAAVARKRAA